MDISRQLPSDVSKTPGEYEAVAVLHKALVSLREELSKRDTHIKVLEDKLFEAEKGTHIKQLQFDDLFELVEQDEIRERDETSKIKSYRSGRRTSKDPLEEIEIAASDEEEFQQQISKQPVVPCSDLVSAFSVEDIEDEDEDKIDRKEDTKKRKICREMNNGLTIELIPHEDVEVHLPPSDYLKKVTTIGKSPIRPILKVPTFEQRSNSGSQTDISALRNSTGSAGFSKPRSRNWSSEPTLTEASHAHENFHKPSKSSTSNSVTFLLPTQDTRKNVDMKLMEDDSKYNFSKKVSRNLDFTFSSTTSSTKCTKVDQYSQICGGGRYSILNRDFSPKYPKHFSPIHIDISSATDEVDSKKGNGVGNSLLQAADINELKESFASTFSHNYHSGSNESGSESTDSLLDEATEYLKVARAKLVTVQDWNRIEEERIQKKKLKKKIKRSPQSFMFLSPSNGQPFVPSSINDLQPNYLARAISPTHGLVTGTIIKVFTKEKHVEIKLRQGLMDFHHTDNLSPNVASLNLTIPFRNVIMVWKKDSKQSLKNELINV